MKFTCIHSGALSNTFRLLLAATAVLAVGIISACSAYSVVVPKITTTPTYQHHDGKFVWFDLFSNDLESASHFYNELFGWTFLDITPENEHVKTIMKDGHPIGNAILLDPQKSEQNESQWLSYMSVSDVDQASKLVEKNNGTVLTPPKDLPERGRIAIVLDPEGALFALITTTDGDPPDREFMVNSWMGSELWSKKWDDAFEFYHLLAGYENQIVEITPGIKYRALIRNNQLRAGIVDIPWDDVKPNWLPYIMVDDVITVSKKAEKLGGELLIEPDPEIRKGRTAIISDPSGAVFAVQQY